MAPPEPVNEAEKSAAPKEKNDDFGKMAASIDHIKEVSEDAGTFLENCERLTDLGKELNKARTQSKSVAKAAAGYVRKELQAAGQGKLTGIVPDLVLSEIKKLTTGQIADTKKRIIQLSETYRTISAQGITLPPTTRFTSSDYLAAGYNSRIADAMEYAVENCIRRMENEERATAELCQRIEKNCALASVVSRLAPQTARALLDGVTSLAPIVSLEGIGGFSGPGGEIVGILAECAIGLIGIQSELVAFQRNGVEAARVLKGQASAYRFTISSMRAGHDEKVKDMAKYIRNRPDDIPANSSKDALAVYFLWVAQNYKKASP